MTAPILFGVKSIALHLHMTERQARYLIAHERIPVFRLGKIVCSTAETLARHFETLAQGDTK